jgi:uncharacterized damage-inducible protein DinB
MPEAWLRGPVPGVPAELMPAAHAFIDALEELAAAAVDLAPGELWLRPGGAASVGFHLTHARGSTERLLTYARGELLSPAQIASIREEGEPADPPASAAELLAGLRQAVSAALEHYRGVDPATLREPRRVGRAGLPSTVHGVLFHAAEHTRRHAGQVVTTVRIIRGLGLAGGPAQVPEV